MASILSDSTNSQQQQDINPLITQAYGFLVNDKPQQAIQIYKKCIQEHPTIWRAYQNLGVAYIMSRRFQQAYEILKKYVEHVPKDPLGHDSLGVSYSELEDPLQAIASFVNAINLSPSYYMSYYNLGVVLGKLGLFDLALNVYNKCLELNPTYVNAMNNIADIYKRYGKLDSAIGIFQKVIQIDPTYYLGIKNLGNCYLANKNYYKALLNYLKYIDAFPDKPQVLANLSLCLDHYGLYKMAATCLRKAYVLQENKKANAGRIYLAGNLFCRELHKLNSYLRVGIKFNKLDRNVIINFYQNLKSALQCFQETNNILPQSLQSLQNYRRTKFNYIGYRAKMGHPLKDIDSTIFFDYFPQSQKIKKYIHIQQKVISSINKWNKYLKRLIKQSKKRSLSSFDKMKYLSQKKQLHQTFAQPYYEEKSLNIKSCKYISRVYNHKFRRLIMKRYNFIKKFNKFNKEFQRFFKYRPMLTTLMISRSESSINGEIPEQNNT